jgi:hypothetical protein
MNYEKEASLRQPIHRYFNALNYSLYDEVRLFARNIDVVAKKGSSLATVELKLHDWTRAMQQAYLNLHVADYSYVALPEDAWSRVSPRLHSLASANGIGLMSVDGEAKLIMRARPSQIIHRNLRKGFLRNIARATPD